MAGQPWDYNHRHLEAARGYLMLNMADHALRELTQVDDHPDYQFDREQLRGEACRVKKDYGTALKAFEHALDEDPEDISVMLAMAWCYKRTDRLADAIEVTEKAYQAHPDEAIVLYNLSCYYSLAGDKDQALTWLGRALRMQGELRQLISDETDFDPMRNDPDFQFIIADPT